MEASKGGKVNRYGGCCRKLLQKPNLYAKARLVCHVNNSHNHEEHIVFHTC